MKTPTLSVLVCAFMFLAAADAGIFRYCDRGWFSSLGSCYYYVPTYLTWAAAERNCHRMGAHLASVHSTFQHRMLQTVILRYSRGYPRTWLGANDLRREGTWQWSDGTPFNYRYYGKIDNHYGQHCLQMNAGAYRYWDDLECYKMRPSVCAKRAYSRFIGKKA